MKRITSSLFVVFTLALFIIIAGCDSNSPSVPDETLAPIDQDLGGYTAADEAPESFLVDDFELQDEEIFDGISNDPEFNALLDSQTVDVYHVRIFWGHLEWDSTATTTTDWSGNAEINKGIMALTRLIRFERSQDHPILPRSNPKVLEWVSNTSTHFDGIHLTIVAHDTTNENETGVLSLNFGPYSNSFTFEDLDSLDIIEDVDNMGNQVAIVSVSREVIPFAGGFLEGRWVLNPKKSTQEKDNGRFWGRWIHSTGMHAGYLKGIWGTNRFDQNVFYGKYLSINGKFKGFLRGNWDYIDEFEGLGEFRGNWVSANLTKLGKLNGKFNLNPDDEKAGHFKGHWHSVR